MSRRIPVLETERLIIRELTMDDPEPINNFRKRKLGRIIATTGPNNRPSQKVMRKMGMTVQQFQEPHLPGPQVVGVLENNLS